MEILGASSAGAIFAPAICQRRRRINISERRTCRATLAVGREPCAIRTSICIIRRGRPCCASRDSTRYVPHARIRARAVCPDCFAVEMACHRDCWGAATNIASLVGLMEPGNKGVVYSRVIWQWFIAHVAEFCQPYGNWDVNLYYFLEKQKKFLYALTFLKTRIQHMSTCRSSRTHIRVFPHTHRCVAWRLLRRAWRSTPSKLLQKVTNTLRTHGLYKYIEQDPPRRLCMLSTIVWCVAVELTGGCLAFL